MALNLRKGGVWQSITGLKLFAGGSWRTIANAKLFKGGVWIDAAVFVEPFTASASPSSVSGSGPNTIVGSNTTTVTPTGGRSPYTYSWAVTGGAVAISPTSATTRFSKGGLASGDSVSGVGTCTVTDNLGSTATATVSYTLERL